VRFDADVQIPHAEMIVAQGVFETILERYERDLEVLSLTTGDDAAAAIEAAYKSLCQESREKGLPHPLGALSEDPKIRQKQIRRRKVCLNYLLTDLESENNAPLDALSARQLLVDAEYPGGDQHILGGVEEVVLPLVASPHLLEQVATNRAVREVKYSGNVDKGVKVVVEHLDGGGGGGGGGAKTSEMVCDALVLTVPIPLLQSKTSKTEQGEIVFSPPLPSWKRNAIEAKGFGNYNKIALKWKREDIFWPVEAQIMSINFSLASEREGGWRHASGLENMKGDMSEEDSNLDCLMLPRRNLWIFNHMPVEDEPMLVVMISATLADEMRDSSTVSLVNRVMAAIRVPFPKAPKPEGSWDLNEWSQGGWSFHKKGSTDQHVRDLISPISSVGKSKHPFDACRLLFAGEATSEVRPGYMDGAIETGEREAVRLIQALEAHTPKSRL